MQHCLTRSGAHTDAAHLGVMQDCISLCQLNAPLMLRNSQFALQLCELCLEVCALCAVDCSKDEFKQDAMMQECAKVCQDCAASCRQMTKDMIIKE